MTITTEADMWLVVCDGCGEKLWFEADIHDRDEAVEQLIDAMWSHRPEERQVFRDGIIKYTETYQRDLCDVCAGDEPAPRPVLRAIRHVPWVKPDAFANDPCDEWPRAAVWQAVGLATCGHPRGSIPCEWCREEAQNGRGYR